MHLTGKEHKADKQKLYFEQFLAKDNAKQVSVIYYVNKILKAIKPSSYVLDLGCGCGKTKEIFRKVNPHITWIGMDIKDSPEVRIREKEINEIITFDGINIPLGDKTIDVIYIRQVLEHVEYLHELRNEMVRVLKPGGHVIGSVSQLEPYHSLSIFNITIYGLCKLLNYGKLKLREIRPGIDGITLIIRKGTGQSSLFDHWFNNESPINMIIGFAGWILRWPIGKINLVKLVFSGHIVFWASKE